MEKDKSENLNREAAYSEKTRGEKTKVCFIDSGVGGYATYLAFCNLLFRRDSKSFELFYFADALNSPYGAKPKTEIVSDLCAVVCKLQNQYKIKNFVLACNTATACAIDLLRANFPNLQFFGIEPAIKPALKTGQKTLVMLTTATFFNSRLVKRFKDDRNLYFLPLTSVAHEIDEKLNDQEALNALTQRVLRPYVNKGIKNVVLGCTHYNFLRPYIKRALGDVIFFEPSLAVATRVYLLL